MNKVCFTFENISLTKESFDELCRVLRVRLEARRCQVGSRGLTLSFDIRPDMDSDSFHVYNNDGKIMLEANNLCTLYAAAGRLMTLGRFDGEGGFTLPALPIRHKMKKSLRGMYLASHFFNYHHAAPFEESREIIADLALRGYNTLMMIIGVQHYESYSDPEAVEMIELVKRLLAYGTLCGMAPAMVMFSNTGFKTIPEGLEAQSKTDDSGRYRRDLIAVYNTEICPSKPEGMAEIERQHRAFFEAFRGTPIKYFFEWAYDEGGCLCKDCYPWVTNGFMKVAELDRRLIPEYGFDAQLCISTWHFGLAMENEWEIFYDKLVAGEYSWAPYIMTAFQSGRLPKVFVERGVPEGVRFIDFPDISMCGAYTWGGFGANPISMFLDNAEKNCGAMHDGGFPYSEGIYEDINKWICAGFYCGYYDNSADAVRDYIRFEYGLEDTETLLRAIQLMESSLPRTVERNPDKPWAVRIRWGTAIPEVYRILTEIEPKVPEAYRHTWKWRCLYLRAVIDYRLYLNLGVVKNDEIAQECYREIRDMFHLENAIFHVSTLCDK